MVLAATLVALGLVAALGVGPVGSSSHCSSQATAAQVRDCETLLAIKDQLAGESDGLSNWVGTTPINNWAGITSNSSGVRVIVFDANIKLNGSIPKELGTLSNLASLNFTQHNLTGRIPKELGNLSALSYLTLAGNRLTGSIPKELGKLSNLSTLYLQQNQLTGSLPKELGDLSSLQYLSFAENKLTGSIPTQFGNLSDLKELFGQDNRLTGSIPTGLGNLEDLTKVRLYGNRFTGSIPSTLGNLGSLDELILYNNQLSGAIPAQLGSLNNLTYLMLNDNRLSGAIPTELRYLSNLTTLYLHRNQLSGAIPAQLGSLSNLTRLYLHNNQLSGAIPTALGSLSSLTRLYLQNNQLTGGIPTQLSSLASLTELSLHRNPNLGGSIPSQLGNLANLKWLWLDKAGLTGPIPSTLGQLSQLQVLALSCNQLDGTVPGALGNAGSAVSGNDADGNPLKTRIYLQGNDLVDALDAPLRRAAQLPASLRSAEDGGTKRTSPELEVTLGGRCRGDPPPAPKSTSKSKPAPTPAPAPTPTVIGATAAAQAILPPDAGAPLRLERLDQPGTVIDLAIGSISPDRTEVTLGAVIRDAADGQTYLIVRREPLDADGSVVRRWVPPTSPLVNQILWADVIANYTVPTDVLTAIPLDGLPTVPGQAVRSHDPADPRIFRWDGVTHQWRHVPDPATFQALGLYWCDVTAADPAFFTRLPAALLGPPYPASTEPARADYPTCHAA